MLSELKEAGLLSEPPTSTSGYDVVGMSRELRLNRPGKKTVTNGCITGTLCPRGIYQPKCI